MDPTYHIAGADGRTYGPAPAGQVLTWVREGRVRADTMVFRSDQADWQPACQFSELGLEAMQAPLVAASAANMGVSGPPPPDAAGDASDPGRPAAGPVVPAAALALEPVIKSGASWFYWIAGLSLVNTISVLAGSQSGFLIGLGITQVVDALAHGAAGGAGSGGARGLALALDLAAYAALILLGILAYRKRTGAFVGGMVLYALDALIYVLARDWLAVGFHGFALFFIFRGFAACREYRRLTVP